MKRLIVCSPSLRLIRGLLLWGLLLIMAPAAVQAQIDSIPPDPELIGQITPKRVVLGQEMRFTVVSDVRGTVTLRVSNPPPGSSFTDFGDGTGEFVWTPITGQEGVYDVGFEAIGGTSRQLPPQNVPLMVSAHPLSHGFYRIGYGDGTDVFVSRDHISHTPPLKIDLRGLPQGSNHPIVAAADGRIMEIVDTNTNCCSVPGCADCNNHVRIKHANGEWTKYTHFQTGTVTGDAGLVVGQCVTAGTFLGWEGDVGHSSGGGSTNRFQTICDDIDTTLFDSTKKCGIHLHFEVRSTSASSSLRVPLICDISGNLYVDNDTHVAAPCDGSGCTPFWDLPAQAWAGSQIEVIQAEDSIRAGTYLVTGTASVAFFAGKKVHLKPGFKATSASYFHAMINDCDGSPAGCPDP